MQFFDRETPPLARTYLIGVILTGFVILAHSLYITLSGEDFRWVYLACLTVLAGAFRVRIPFTKGKLQSLTVTINDIFVFTAILLFGPEIAVTVVLIDSIVVTAISSMRI